jgi:hypothetical protein
MKQSMEYLRLKATLAEKVATGDTEARLDGEFQTYPTSHIFFDGAAHEPARKVFFIYRDITYGNMENQA